MSNFQFHMGQSQYYLIKFCFQYINDSLWLVQCLSHYMFLEQQVHHQILNTPAPLC